MDTEFKREVTDKIAKEAVAFSNTRGGAIYVGFDDEGNLVGLQDADFDSRECVHILSDKVRPDITMTSDVNILEENGLRYVKINVNEGHEKPYYLREKGLRAEGVFVRKGSMSVPVTESALNELIFNKKSKTFESLPSLKQDLTFDYMSEVFEENGLTLTKEQMKSLHLIENEQFTNLGYILSDQFDTSVKLAVYSDDYKSSFIAREESTGSVLKQYFDAFEFISKYNKKRSVIEGRVRKDFMEYPEPVIREALLNALIHRSYSTDDPILVSMFADRLSIMSPGGMNRTYSEEDLKIGVSSLRNKNLAAIFFRLGHIESHGSGIPRIFNFYNGLRKPQFDITPNLFRITLYSISIDGVSVNGDIEEFLKSRDVFTRSELQDYLRISKSSAVNMISGMIDEGLIVQEGQGRNIKYVTKI